MSSWQAGRSDGKEGYHDICISGGFTPKKDGKGYDAYFPDLECCEAEGPDLEDAVENAREAAYNWISLELEEEGDLPAQTHIDDMSLPEGSMVKQIMVRIKLLPDND